MKLTPYLERTPLNLSGGQQQRTALARAIVKNASLVLLDEPLANLDYKLREELREELPRLFAAAGSIFVYATTEPQEALLLGGHTATMHQGRISQFGPTISVYRKPADIVTAKTFADPPLNTLDVVKSGNSFERGGLSVLPVPAHLSGMADGAYTIAFHPHHLSLARPHDTSGTAEGAHHHFGNRRFGKLHPCRLRGIALGHARTRHPRHRAGYGDRAFRRYRHLMAFGPDGRAIGGSAASQTVRGA